MTNFWILNPDAELEMANLAAGKPGRYTSPLAARATLTKRRAVFDELTLGETALLAHELDQVKRLRKGASSFILWCPTPSLLGECRRHGLRVPAGPEPSLLLAVNDKTRLQEWGLPLVPERTLLRKLDDLNALQKDHKILRLKRPFGFAGRGQRRISDPLSADDTRWILDGLRKGPLVAEPELCAFRLKSVHLLVHRDGSLIGRPLGFACDDFGAFQYWETRTVPGCEDEALRKYAADAAQRLLSAGYFGPAGIDFAVNANGKFYALDLNGRFSLGWSRGLGELRDRALLLCRAQES